MTDSLIRLGFAAAGLVVVLDAGERLVWLRGRRRAMAAAAGSSDLADQHFDHFRHTGPRPGWAVAAMVGGAVLVIVGLVDASPGVAAAAACVALAASVHTMGRTEFGNQGSDGMRTHLLLGVAVHGAPGMPDWIGPAVVAGVVAAAYGSAGWHKLVSRPWRSGDALAGVGHAFAVPVPPLGEVAPVLTRFITAWELLVPVAIILGGPVLLPTLAIGLAFHLAIGLALGLSSFFWAFVGTYPWVLAFGWHHGVLA